MSVKSLKEYLENNVDDIIKILEETDFHSISFSEPRNEIRCAYYPEGNPTSVLINCDNLFCHVFSKDINANLIELVAMHNNWNIAQAVQIIAQILNIKNIDSLESPYIFNGFYKHNKGKGIFKNYNVLSKEILIQYIDRPNIRFLKDNISLNTQFKFQVKYDSLNNRIIVPWFNARGDLVGITGRYNFNELGSNPKWKAMESFSKGQFIYGLYENQKEIEKAGWVIIGESEKFVMQLDSMGYHNALALGNCTITATQARILKSLPVDKIILAFDEGVNIEHLMLQCDKLKGGIFSNTKEIKVIYDSKHEILKQGSKMSPSDVGKENFEILLDRWCFKKE